MARWLAKVHDWALTWQTVFKIVLSLLSLPSERLGSMRTDRKQLPALSGGLQPNAKGEQR